MKRRATKLYRQVRDLPEGFSQMRKWPSRPSSDTYSIGCKAMLVYGAAPLGMWELLSELASESELLGEFGSDSLS